MSTPAAQSALRLYRRVMTANRTLPVAMREMGDGYARDEFKKHKNADASFVAKFTKGWEEYASMLEQQQIGRKLTTQELNSLNDEQLGQLDALREEVEASVKEK
ncbi:hypothetical protein, variant [Sphaeroforma arctica JP610]|uniref:Succinate dehydrogenase assembly factor 3 n=1 Tax=Sphaeroforma arctica JP610 TaxID=667725 RepID=A0A0L0FFW3_9EUKA|nr:hypothetical protein, variant [Sphaeroforma arctica JP610]KNC75659.1 hypothetical protein, variant [Sphaeroforma arctica JP610]|eukprot:XP_014149561.1 hypothetical protein, variant [Sphaeroforma arctica JP610]